MLSILIVNWNTREYLRGCLSSLRVTCADIEHEIIVVDNDSGDGSASMVATEFPEVRLFANQINTGFAAGNNQAYRAARGDLIWLLNPDTEVLANAPQQLIDFLTHPPARAEVAPEKAAPGEITPIGAVASVLIDARTGLPQRSCRTFPTPAALWAEATGLASFYPRSRRFGFYRMGWWRYHNTRPVQQPMASSLLLTRRAIEKAGGLFDEQFPIYFNDVDLCYRLWKAGFSIWYLHTACVKHYGGASTGQVRPAMIRESHESLLRFYAKYYRGAISPILYAATVLLVIVTGMWRYSWARRKAEKADGTP